MPLWSEDLTTCTLEDVLLTQSENRTWQKELRLKTNTLINRRLAKEISREEYDVNKRLAVEESVECRRRALKLVDEIASRHCR